MWNIFRNPRHRQRLKWNLNPKKFPSNSQYHAGGKVNLPQLILEQLVVEGVPLPYTFEISHSNRVFKTHCGVLEFTAADRDVIMPNWMYSQLELDGVDSVSVSFIKFPRGKYVKLLPHDLDFLEVENPKAELERTLTNYQVLTPGDMIVCQMESGKMRFTVSEIQPEALGIYIVDTDLEVDFLPPIGFEEKMERERTVLRYVEVIEGKQPRQIRMTRFGLYFNNKEEITEK